MQDKKNLEEQLNQEAVEKETTETISTESVPAEAAEAAADKFEDTPLDKNVKLMSPGRMVARRFFRSKLSITGLIMLIVLFLFSWLGPVVYHAWGETETDRSGKTDYSSFEVSAVEGEEEYGEGVMIIVRESSINRLARPSIKHLLGTDEGGKDVFMRLMYGGRLSLLVSFIAVILTTVLGVVLGGVAGYYGGWVDNVIMRFCDVLMCLPTLPLMLILGTVLNENGISAEYYIYILMILLSAFSWPGMARLVRGQILFLREQEYMVAAEAMGYSSARRIFKHLIPNVLPQIIVTMTMSLGSMILYESALSYLGLGVKPPYASWGTMVSIISGGDPAIMASTWAWVPAGICIVLAVLGFNFIGDGLRDALDPKQRR
ncbi:MAG: ABC transporter permease [Clostridiales bacterium]|nr:ABC transporter permease [Clostridiales bacterium]